MTVIIHSKEDFKGMRNAGKLAAEVLDYITGFIQPGVTTNKLNELCHDFIIKAGAIPAPLNYKGYPKSICTSKNNVICHGIPDDVPLKNGDIMNIDVTVILDGWHGDTSRMYFIGEPPIKAKRLCQATYEALMIGIEQVKPGTMLNNIGKAIQKHIAGYGYSIVHQYCGHGIGKEFHAAPSVVHYATDENDMELQTGMFFTIEPMINIGKPDAIVDKSDGWTVRTRDTSLSAQFEHTIGVTEDSFEIFTKSPKGLNFPLY
jgi:methionyl aminopeptidase